MKQRVFSLLVDNTSGALSRVSGLFSRRGYNIDSLTVGVTADPKFSRMTIVASGDDLTLEQIGKQLEKLVDVRDLKILKTKKSVRRELILVKIRCDKDERQNVITLANIYRGRVVDTGHHSMIIELTGDNSKLEAFLTMLDGYEILELARTGLTGLSRGIEDVTYL
ncbi:MAG TPA: acetolactate synthase small subunit [Lachnospiraceae bacterium]|nr:acetolactate synthase small subunit [Lachnospiraceae bacterium]